MGAVPARFTGSMGASRAVAAVNLVPVPNRRPSDRQYNARQNDHRHFPGMHEFMESNHESGDRADDSKTRQKPQKAENRWKNAAENMAGFRKDHRPR